MTERRMPSSRELLAKLRVIDAVVAIPALVLIISYLVTVLEIRPGEGQTIMLLLAGYALVSGGFYELRRRRQLAPLCGVLDAGDTDLVSSDELEDVFRTVLDLPRRGALDIAILWSVPGVTLPLGMHLLGHSGWLSLDHWIVMGVTAISGSVVSCGFLFFLVKSELESTREGLGRRIDDSDVRERLITPFTMAAKVQSLVVGTVVMTLLLTVSLSYSRSVRAVDAQAMQWQGRVVAALAAEMRRTTFNEARVEVLPVGAILPYSIDFDVLEPGETGEAGDGEIDWGDVTGHPEATGSSSVLVADHVVSWQRLDDGRLLVASVEADELQRGFGAFGGVLALLSLLTCGVALSLAWLFARDIRRGATVLQAEAVRLASGDLRRGRVWEAEDEMGGLGRSFERMAAALRKTVGAVAGAADRVDSAVADISAVSRSVAVASADQVRRIQQASDLMLEINQQVRGVSGSAQALNLSVEESSSSILELGAAGDELNETATVLSGKVDEVSGSIEQMVRSVKEVSSASEQLSDAAAETSSSMEEMASAMRAVDTTAELTATLSSDVVVLSEGGQQRVSQTMEGMDGIRDATDAAEQVIRGLGARAQEIGGILVVIEDVADETNLLALNAAIISAQAGEHGRAFSVVADEIKELADRVLASTKEIGLLIRSVQEESEAAVGAIEKGSQSVAGGVELSAEAGSSLEEITRAARESGTRISEIVSAVREQTKATGHVVGLMEAVRDGVEHISRVRIEQDGANEVVYRSAITMQEVAQQVRRTTEEQSRGFGRIRESIEGVRGAVEDINGSLRDQSSACSQVAEFLEQVADGTRSNEEAAQRMGESMRVMTLQAEALREDLEEFQL